MHHMIRSDMGVFGFAVTLFIHLNIYFFLFCLAGMAQRMKSLLDRKETLKVSTGGTYNALELEAPTFE